MNVTDNVTNRLPKLSVTTTLYIRSYMFQGTLPSSGKILSILHRSLDSSVKCKLGYVLNVFIFFTEFCKDSTHV